MPRRLAVVAFYLAVYVLPLGLRPLIVPDEFRYAQVSREMITGGDWIVPHLDGFVYFEKPVLGYWLNAASILLLGENRFALRLPSAVATGLTAAVLAWLVTRVRSRGGSGVAPLAALIFLSSLAVAAVGRSMTLDAFLTLFVTVSLACCFMATLAPRASRRESGWLVLAGIGCGLAFLAKGFLAVVLPALVVGPFLVWQRRARDLVRMALPPALAALAIALPWSVLVHRRAPDFWRFFLWNEHVRRFLVPDAAQHPRPWWLYLVALPGLLLPWSFVVPAVVRGWADVERPAERALIRFCCCWSVLPFLFFSASSGKLLTYVLPIFPASAILVALGLYLGVPARRSMALRRCAVVAAACFAIAVLAALALQVLGSAGGRPYERSWKTVAVSCGLLLIAALFGFLSRDPAAARRVWLVGLASAPLLLLVQLALPDRMRDRTPGEFLERHRAAVKTQTLVLADGGSVTPACWVFRRDNVLLVQTAGELAYGVERDAPHRLLDVGQAADVIARNRGGVVLVTKSAKYARWKDRLPRPVLEDVQGGDGFVFVRY
jgi:4-amino-4-deoxy-L-arabinose transferase